MAQSSVCWRLHGYKILVVDEVDMQRETTAPLYETIGTGYARVRRADPRIAQAIREALGNARTVVNVGAGTGNYEPRDGSMIAVEPARTMLAQRAATQAPAVQAVAEALPFPDLAFDAALATFTLHHWSDLAAGLRELRRVARRQVIVLNEPAIGRQFWLAAYFHDAPMIRSEERAPSVADLERFLAVRSVQPLLVPPDCTDGFIGAYWSRPEAYLDETVRAGMSTLAQLPPEALTRGLARLARDLANGAWDARYGRLRTLPSYDVGYRLVICGVE
jgi:SAM-dependent methyltransferase